MENVLLVLIYKKIVSFIRKIKNKTKEKFLFILGVSLFVLFCFFITNVKASDVLWVDGYDMSDAYNYFNNKSFFIFKVGSSYYFMKPSDVDWSYCCVDSSTHKFMFCSSNWSYYVRNNLYVYNVDTCKFSHVGFYGNSLYSIDNCEIKYNNKGIYWRYGDLDKTLYMEPTSIVAPFVDPTIKNSDEDLLNRSTEVVIVDAGSISQYDDTIKFSVSRLDKEYFDDDVFLYSPVELFSTELNWTSLYYKSLLDNDNVVTEFNYQIPYSDMKIVFEENKTYQYCLNYVDDFGVSQNVTRNVVIGSLTETEKLKNDINIIFNDFSNKLIESNNKTQEAIKEQTNAIEENNKTNKNIFERIGEMLNYINPFSENFFVYKLIELLINALKSLFIPSDNFFNDWLSDMNDYFSDRFGLLYYPIDLVIDFLTRFVDSCTSVSDSCVINVPDLKIMDTTLIKSFTFDFKAITENDTFNTVYNIYLVVIDVIFSLMLVNFAKNTFSEIFGGRFSDEIIGNMTSDDRSYRNYERYQNNKQKYKNEHGGAN